jgi:uncharacterized protein (TIGR03083 family)
VTPVDAPRTLTTDDYLAAISLHSFGFAETVRGRLDRPVEHCPGWSVADLVAHLTGVHWFWATIAEERLDAPPRPERRPARAPEESLVDAFVAGASRLVDVLRGADQSASCWTWAPGQQDIGFITRHQVQETAVHHWDAGHAGGREVRIAPAVAADAVQEFLTFSVSSETDPADPARPALDGQLVLRASDVGQSWSVTDARTAGTVRVQPGPAEGPALEATAADLLLWLYGRRELDSSALPAGLVGRFRALCFTD